MARPRFSVLIPSRNRLDLLRYAVESVIAQGRSDVEIVVSDNYSKEDYQQFLRDISTVTIVYSRSSEPISVTENWNRALDLATGDYTIMLGDDDALAPGMLDRIDDLAIRYAEPDCLYVMAYNYAYPGVFPDNQSGYLCTVSNSPLFDAQEPYMLEPAKAIGHAADGLRLHHSVSFNAQHFIWRNSFIKAGPQPFFQSPYPDYFACFTTMGSGARILVIPFPEVFIGISKSSFGYYFANGREDEGFAEFVAAEVDVNLIADGSKAVLSALLLPGSRHYRNWLIAALTAQRHMNATGEWFVDLRRYASIQLYGIAFDVGFTRKIKSNTLNMIGKCIDQYDRARLAAMIRGFSALRLSGMLSASQVSHGIAKLLLIHATPNIFYHNIIVHYNIMDAYNFVKNQDLPLNSTRPEVIADPRDVHIAKLTAALAATSNRADRVDHLEEGLADKDAHIEKLSAILADVSARADRVASLEESLAGKNAHIEKLSTVLVEACNRADRVGHLEEGLADKDAHIEKLSAILVDVSGRAGRVASLEERLTDKNAHIEKLSTALVEADREIEKIFALEKGIAEQKFYISQLRGNLDDSNAEIENLKKNFIIRFLLNKTNLIQIHKK